MLQHILRILIYFIIACLANYIYPGSHYLAQGLMLIAFWGTWFHTNDKWTFALEYGKYFNYFGILMLANGCYHFLVTAH